MIESALAEQEGRAPRPADLRRIGIDPDFWYPVVQSRSVPPNTVVATSFAGRRMAVFRTASGTVAALEDRCAHRQVPLSMGVVEGETLRCCYHAWAYRGNGHISQIPYLTRDTERPPRGVRAYPTRESGGLVFVFPGDPAKATTTPLPEFPQLRSGTHKVMRYERTVRCHYSFMHENLLDMNHQFLHRGVLGKIHPELLGYESGPGFVEARYRFTSGGGRKDRGAGLLSAEGIGGRESPDVLTIRTGYPYQTLELVPDGETETAFSLWVAYVPVDAAQRTCRVQGMLMIRKPRFAAALTLAWPFMRRFTERVFSEDRMAVEAEQRAWDEQGEDRNNEIFPLILDLRHVLRTSGVPIDPAASVCGSGSACGVGAPS